MIASSRELKVTDHSITMMCKLAEAKTQIIKNNYAKRLTDKTVVPLASVLRTILRVENRVILQYVRLQL